MKRKLFSLINFKNYLNLAERIFKFVSCTGGEEFVTHITQKKLISNENGSNNKMNVCLNLIIQTLSTMKSLS
jgi:hypothetical protein